MDVKTSIGMLAAVAALGCTYKARFDSDPPGATVYIDGVPRGVTPLELELPENEGSYTLRIARDGYEPITQVVSPVPDGGSVTFSNTFATANVQATTQARTNSNGYGASGVSTRGTANTHAFGTGTTTTITNTLPTYTWPTRFFFTLRPSSPASSPWPRTQPAGGGSPRTSATPARRFCGSCGTPLQASPRYCGTCGARTEH